MINHTDGSLAECWFYYTIPQITSDSIFPVVFLRYVRVPIMKVGGRERLIISSLHLFIGLIIKQISY